MTPDQFQARHLKAIGKASGAALLATMTGLLLAGCKTKPEVIVDTRPPVETVRYVPIPAKLTQPVPIAEGKLPEVIEVARERKAQLQQCNASLEAIGKIQGTKVPC